MMSFRQIFRRQPLQTVEDSSQDLITVLTYVDIDKHNKDRIHLFSYPQLVEDICLKLCTELNLTTRVLPLLGIQEESSKLWLPSNDIIQNNELKYVFGLRFGPCDHKINDFIEADPQASYYYFLQYRTQFINNMYRMEEQYSNGLAIVDCIRLLNEHSLTPSELFRLYSSSKFLPKEYTKAELLERIFQNWRRNSQFKGHIERSRSRNQHTNRNVCKAYVKQGLANYTADLEAEKFRDARKQHLKVDSNGIMQENRLLCSHEDIECVHAKGCIVEIGRHGLRAQYLKLQMRSSKEAMSLASCLECYHRLSVSTNQRISNDVYSPRHSRYLKLKISPPVSRSFFASQQRKFQDSLGPNTQGFVLVQHEQHVDDVVVYILSENTVREELIKKSTENTEVYRISDRRYRDLRELIDAEFKDMDRLVLEEDPKLLFCRPSQPCRTWPLPAEPPQDEIVSNPGNGPQLVEKLQYHIDQNKKLEGKFSVVYKASRNTESNQTTPSVVAVKQPKEGMNNRIWLLLDSANSIAFLKHDHIVQIYEFCHASPCSYTMEYARYGNLATFLRQNESAVKSRHLYMASLQLAQAIEYLGSQTPAPIAHGNIRCRNCLVYEYTPENITIKLADPGIRDARLPWRAIEFYNINELGKIVYTHQSDIFAYGMTIMEMYQYGVPPYEGFTEQQIRNDLMNRSDYDFKVPETETQIKDVHFECCSEDPLKRPEPVTVTCQLESYSNQQMMGTYAVVARDAQELKGVDKYSAILGKGQYGTVHLGCYAEKDVAIKVVNKYNTHDEMLREITVMVGLKHENIVNMIGKVTKDSHIWIVMEKLDTSLLAFLRDMKDKNEVTSKALRLKMAKDICKGMEYLHSRKVVHRDLAARNVLLLKSGRVGEVELISKVSDFGLSRFIEENEYYAYVIKTLRVQMPCYWYPPELVNSIWVESGAKAKCTKKMDVWSYSITLWEIYMYGERVQYPSCPRERATEDRMKFFQTLYEILMSGERLALPDEVEADGMLELITAAWATNPDDRPSFSEMLQTLNAL